jgi:hypothetical protein
MVPTPVAVLAIFAYIGLSGLALRLLEGFVSRGSRPTAALIFGLIWACGWVWLLGALALGSARGGVQLLRAWIAMVGGLSIAVAPFALIPHPATIVAGVIGGVAFGTWVVTGRAHWLHKE